MEDKSLAEQLREWVPSDGVGPDESHQWQVNPDGSVTITLPSVIAFNLADTLLEWESHGKPGWTHRPDCQNWKRSPIARENRRETIVYGNLFGSIACLLGRPEVRALMQRVAEIKQQEPAHA